MTATLPKRVLVVDDDRLVRELWVDVLTGAGYRTLQAENGHDAIELMRAAVPDLVLLDLRMPDLTGGEVLQYLQGSAVLRRIPVLIVSGFLSDEETRGSLGLNIVGRLPKPLPIRQLEEAVWAALATPGEKPWD
jgi:two-component system, cell cycle response regulator DivK